MLKLSFRPISRSRAGSRCHRYFFCPSDHLSVRPAVSPSASDRQSVRPTNRQSVRSPSVRQSVSPSTISPSFNRPAVNCPSVRPSTVVRLSTVFIWKKKHTHPHTHTHIPHKKSELEIRLFRQNRKKALYFRSSPEGVVQSKKKLARFFRETGKSTTG